MKQRAYVAGILGGLAALVVLAIVIVQFGRYDPTPPSLEKHPIAAIPGELVWWDKEGCIMLGAASGANRRELHCPPIDHYGASNLQRVDANSVQYYEYSGAPGPQVVTVFLDSGQVTRTPSSGISKPLDGYNGVAPDGTSAFSRDDGSIWVTEAGQSQHQIADFDVAKYHAPRIASWSPDSQWMVLIYERPRDNYDQSEIWILSRDGKTSGSLTEHARGYNGVSWWIEGLGAWPK